MSDSRRRRGASSASPSPRASSPVRRQVKQKLWPTWVLVAVAVVGLGVAGAAQLQTIGQVRLAFAIGGFAGVLVLGTACMFAQRIMNIGASRVSGDLGFLAFTTRDRIAFALLILASIANGIVIALQVARQ